MSTGKWAQAGIPHKGWTAVSVDDLGEPSEICDMCERQTIRYVHTVTHPDYQGELRVGCECANNLCQNYDAKGEEQKLRSLAKKRAKWLDRNWKIAATETHWLKVGEWKVFIFRKEGSWKFSIDTVHSGPIWGQLTYPNESAAKLAAFDFLAKRCRW